MNIEEILFCKEKRYPLVKKETHLGQGPQRDVIWCPVTWVTAWTRLLEREQEPQSLGNSAVID